MEILLYAGIVLLTVTQSTLSKLVGKDGNQNIFNLSKCIAALLMFALFSVIKFAFHLPTLFYGLAFGIFLYLATWSAINALISGPMALTSMLASFSQILPCIYGIIFLGEPFTYFTAIGLLLLASAFILIGATRKSDKSISAKWFFYITVTIITNGACSIILKMHQTDFPGLYRNQFMMYGYFVASIIFFVALLAKLPKKKIKCIDIKGALAGIANGGGNFLTIYLASIADASVMFPVIAVLTAITVLAAGRIIFKEKLTVYQIIGFILGIGSVVLLNI